MLQQQEAGNTFQKSIKSQSIFYATRINKVISPWQNVLIVIVLILINKDVFEPSYDDLNSRSKTAVTFVQPNISSLFL